MNQPKRKLTLTAVVLRNILAVLFFLLLILAVVLAYFGIERLQTTADGVQTIVAEASTIDQTNTRTNALWNELQNNQQAVNRAGQVVAESKSYSYQDVIVRDLRNFAKKAGITITNYDFTVEASPAPGSAPEAATPEPASPAGPANEGEASVGDNAPVTPAVSALKTTSVSVTVETPVDYQRLLRFVNYIEQNLTKMQISQVSLSRVANEGKGKINSDALTIEVYIR